VTTNIYSLPASIGCVPLSFQPWVLGLPLCTCLTLYIRLVSRDFSSERDFFPLVLVSFPPLLHTPWTGRFFHREPFFSVRLRGKLVSGLSRSLRLVCDDFSAQQGMWCLRLSRVLHVYRRESQSGFFTACRVFFRGYTGASSLSLGGWEECWVLITASASPRMGKGTVLRSAPGTAL